MFHVDAVTKLAVGVAWVIPIYLPGVAAFFLLLELTKWLDRPGLWDWSSIIAGLVGGLATYPLHLQTARAAGLAIGDFFPIYRSALVGIVIASGGICYLIWAESTGRLDPPEELAPIAERFNPNLPSDEEQEDCDCDHPSVETVESPVGEEMWGYCDDCGMLVTDG